MLSAQSEMPMINDHSDDMSSSETRANILALYPEDSREAAALLKQAVPLMVRHNIPPNPVHYALWYTYSKGQDPELIRHLDRVVRDFDGCPPEAATRLFRQYIIRDELEDARAEQHQVINLVDGMERDVSRSVQGSLTFQNRLGQCLEMLDEPASDRLPGILSELQQSTRLMQSQQEHFLAQLHSAQDEIKTLRDKLQRAQLAATLDGLTELLNRTAFTRLLEQALGKASRGVALVILDIDHFKQFNDQYGHPLGDRVLQHVAQVLRSGEPTLIILANNAPLTGFLREYAPRTLLQPKMVISFVDREKLLADLGRDAAGVGFSVVVPEYTREKYWVVREFLALARELKVGVTPVSLEGFVTGLALAEGLRNARTESRASLIEGMGRVGALDLGYTNMRFSRSERTGSRFVDLSLASRNAGIV